jgi:hypothetical protein
VINFFSLVPVWAFMKMNTADRKFLIWFLIGIGVAVVPWVVLAPNICWASILDQ